MMPGYQSVQDFNIGYMIILGFAAASGFKLLVADRITQWLRYRAIRTLDKAGGFIPYHLQYLIGCALCSPMWVAIALWFTRQFHVSQWIAMILAARMLGYLILRYVNETSLRDWPTRKDGSEITWPPKDKA